MASGQRTPRTRKSGTQPSNNRPLYQPFVPKSEMKEKEQAYFLRIYLPGFVKEQIKINFERSSRVVKVVGERPLGGNRISNFEQKYPVPENCEEEKLQGKYELGTLVITMPKKPIISQVSPQAQANTTLRKGPITPISPSKDIRHDPKPRQVANEPMPPKSPTTRLEQGEKSSGDKKGPQNVQEETMLKSRVALAPKGEIGKSPNALEKIEPKPTSTMGPIKPIEDNHGEKIKKNDITTYIEKVKQRLNENVPLKEDIKDGKPHEKINSGKKYIEHNEISQGKEIERRPKKAGLVAPPKALETEMERKTVDKGKSKEGEIYTIGKGIKEVVASTSEVVTRIGEGKLSDEEKPLVANMGVAILVIVALGAYVTHKFTSSSKT
ncbi:hypothetical protein Fmac_011797 [Flemingia macrophylla]|uniref:SHSP domain-containing protein n=1 Tax=Flemingia macrophylla TaxID=520843 RepID=A0ABD1MNU4_9FABA